MTGLRVRRLEGKAELTAEALAALEADDAAKAGSSAASATEADLEAEIAAIRQGLKSGTPCSECAYTNEAGSRFCSACGSALGELAAS